MQVNDQLIDRLANLAKLEFKGEEKEAIKEDLSKILKFVEKLNELDTEGVEPLEYITDEVNVLREDEVQETLSKAEALSNAPLKDSDYIKVPKVLKK